MSARMGGMPKWGAVDLELIDGWGQAGNDLSPAKYARDKCSHMSPLPIVIYHPYRTVKSFYLKSFLKLLI